MSFGQSLSRLRRRQQIFLLEVNPRDNCFNEFKKNYFVLYIKGHHLRNAINRLISVSLSNRTNTVEVNDTIDPFIS
jgi:hypothetical protein